MFKLSYKHRTLENLELSQKEYELFLLGRDNFCREDWQAILTIFKVIRIKL